MVTKFITEYYLVNSKYSHLVFILVDVNTASASESIINLKPEGVQFLKSTSYCRDCGHVKMSNSC